MGRRQGVLRCVGPSTFGIVLPQLSGHESVASIAKARTCSPEWRAVLLIGRDKSAPASKLTHPCGSERFTCVVAGLPRGIPYAGHGRNAINDALGGQSGAQMDLQAGVPRSPSSSLRKSTKEPA